MMDMETVLPRTCVTCHGRGYVFFGDTDEWDIQPCENCNDEAGTNNILAADAYDQIEMEMEDKDGTL